MSRFVPSPDFDRIVAKDVESGLREVAQRIADRAGSIAPVGTGHYRESLRATVDDRGVVAESTDVAGHIVESGSMSNPPYAPLRRAAGEIGKFEPK